MKHIHEWEPEPTRTIWLFFTLDRIVEKHRCKCGATKFVDWWPKVAI